MARSAKQTFKVQGKIPGDLYDFVMSEVDERGVDITVVLIDAIQFYKDHRTTPERVEVIVENLLQEKPELLNRAMDKLLDKDPQILQKVIDRAGALLLEKQVSRK